VIALDVVGGAAGAYFEALVTAARGVGFVGREADASSFTLTLAPEASAIEAVLKVSAAASGFDAAARTASARGVVHRGTVFRAEAGSQLGYVGSAIRSTQSILKRAPTQGGLYASKDFAQYVGALGALPFSLTSLNGSSIDGLSVFNFAASTQAEAKNGIGVRDPAAIAFLKKRLAQDVGPFAAPLVDRAVQGSTAANELVLLLGRIIDNPAARKVFEDDVRNFLNGQ
jgi:hypothetical protein